MVAVSPVPAVAPYRAVRATLFAVVCVGVAAVLHAAADGCDPTWSQVGYGLPPVWLLACAGLGRERSGPALTAGLGAMQVGLHYLFAHVGAGMSSGTMSSGAATAFTGSTSSMSMPGMASFASVQAQEAHARALGMFAAHALAVVVCGWWLRQGERDFFALCRIVGALAAAPLRLLAQAVAVLCAAARLVGDGAPRVVRPAPPRSAFKRRRTPLFTTLSFRGPPAFA
jgi:hypothetical protein